MKYQKLFSTIGAIALALTITAGPAEAGKTDWRDSHYNFKSIQTVFVEDIDKSVIKAGDLLEVEITDADEYDLFAKLIRVKSA